MDVPAVIVLEKTCRTCMTQETNDDFIPLFQGSVSCRCAHPEIFEELLFFNLQLLEDDGLPQQICLSCLDTFTQICEFRKQCQAVQENLSVYRPIKKDSIEIERIDFLGTHSESSSSVKDSNEDRIDENLLLEYIEEDYSMDYEENQQIKNQDEMLGFEIKEIEENKITKVDIKSNFLCKFCKKEHVGLNDLSKHIKQCPSRNVEICDYCTNEFECKEKLDAHLKEIHPDGGKPNSPVCSIRYHENNDRFQCSTCYRFFLTANRLKIHEQRVHTIIEKECSICQKKFTNILRYNYHMASHKPKKKYQCQYCDKFFVQIHHKQRHEKIHTGERPYLCNICGKSFQYEQLFKKHNALHDKVPNDNIARPETPILIGPYQCYICGKYFNKKGVLNTHMQTHKRFRPFECDQCEKTWRSKNALQMHKYKAHRSGSSTNENNLTGDYPLRCSFCSKGFLVAYALSEHVKIHSEDRKHVCKDCGYAFKREGHLNIHISRVHKNLRQFPCEHCEKSFVNRGELNAHRVTHNDEKPFKCTFCPNAFKWKCALRTHERTHTGEKPFPCEVCGKRFATSQTLVFHSILHSKNRKKIVDDCNVTRLENFPTNYEEIEDNFEIEVC